jgi:hypothetical protein
MPYTAAKPALPRTVEELREGIPGWGADLDPAVRPSVPRELPVPQELLGTPAPVQQEARAPRERSIEHERLTPVFGTAVPLRGFSGVVRRWSYRRFSEGRAAHWLLLLAADRVDAIESHLISFTTSRPDEPLTESGVLGEAGHHPVASRRGRVDARHQVLDPVVVAGTWVVAALGVVGLVRRLRRRHG